MGRRNWQDWIILAAGLWTVLAPSVLGHEMASPAHPRGVSIAAMWNYEAVGMAVTALAAWALSVPAAWREWANLAFGLWLMISPWPLGYLRAGNIMYNAFCAGMGVALLSGWAIVDASRRTVV